MLGLPLSLAAGQLLHVPPVVKCNREWFSALVFCAQSVKPLLLLAELLFVLAVASKFHTGKHQGFQVGVVKLLGVLGLLALVTMTSQLGEACLEEAL